jgi:cytidylate kinase
VSGRPAVIAIDGAAGSGKSTLARALGRALGLPYVNTGLMYRALAALAIRRGVDPDDADGLVELTGALRFIVRLDPPGELEVEGYDTAELTGVEVESTVSSVARHPGVRAVMRREQRELGGRHGAVMEGRDIASVVFADAPVKLYLRARPEVRVARRASERAADPTGVAAALGERDDRDARTTPHAPTDDAVVIDTSDLDPTAILETALDAVRARAPELLP